MKTQKKLTVKRRRRDFRIGNRVRRSAHGKLRLSVFRSSKHIYAQIIDDVKGHTLVAANSCEKEVVGVGKNAGNKAAAEKVGALIGQRALEKGISEVAFDRGNSRYHGRVAALADAARSSGLKF